MRVRLVFSGGVTGTLRRVEGDLDADRTPELVTRLREAIRTGALRGTGPPDPRHVDAEQLHLEVEDDGRRHSVEVDESQATAEVLELIDGVRGALRDSQVGSMSDETPQCRPPTIGPLELDIQTVGVFSIATGASAGKVVGFWVRTKNESQREFYYLRKSAGGPFEKWQTDLSNGPYILERDWAHAPVTIAEFEGLISYNTTDYDKREHARLS